MTTFPVVLQEWIESESGWGCRPDGYSVHLSLEDSKNFIENFWLEERKRNPSGKVPSCYSRPEGNPFVKDVPEHFYLKLKKLKEDKDKKNPTIWISSLIEIETEPEKAAREKKEQERKERIETERKTRENLKAQALSKLTDAEKKILGLK